MDEDEYCVEYPFDAGLFWLLDEVERLQERIQHKLEEEAAYLDTIRQYAETRDQYAAEVERLREALEFYAEENPIAIEDDNGEIARRVLARQSELAEEFTGKIETVKLYPGKALTPEEISNDYEESRRRLDGEEG